ncbi:MAG: hypothetical protein ACR2OX_11680 [Methyloligellaceae bacterium]
MADMGKRTLEIWLTCVGLAFATFGLLMAFGNETDLFRNTFDPLIERAFWIEEVPVEAREFRSWVYGAWGGTVAGFGLLLAHVARQSIAMENSRMRWGALAALTLWFVIDTTVSVIHGVWGNVFAINVPAYLALALPLFLAGKMPAVRT